MSITVKFKNKFEFGQNFRKISILVKFLKKNVDFGQKFSKFSKNYNLVNISEKFGFFSEISKNFDFGQIFENSFLVKIYENFDSIENFEKFRSR